MIKFYTIGCPKCNVLESIIKQKQLDCEIISDEAKVLDVADKYNTMSAPFAVIDNEFFDSNKLEKYILEQ